METYYGENQVDKGPLPPAAHLPQDYNGDETRWEVVNMIIAMVALGSLVISLVVGHWVHARPIAWWAIISTWALLLFINLALWPGLITSREHSPEEKMKNALGLLFVTVAGAAGAPVVVLATI